jgi:hypothetical protein
MDTKTEGLVRLIDQAIELAQTKLEAELAGKSDPTSVEGLKQIISGLRYRRNQAVETGFKIYDVDISLGLVRAALEYEASDSELVHRIGDVERYFSRHFVRKRV